LRQARFHWELVSANGILVGRLAKSFAPPANMQWISARVAAILVWQADDDTSEFRALTRCERWEVVLPELIFDTLF
jgi:ATP-dependent DNA helicase RecQ